jgi:hypothetical protein
MNDAKESLELTPLFNQDPHAVLEPQENNLQMAIGREVRMPQEAGPDD